MKHREDFHDYVQIVNMANIHHFKYTFESVGLKGKFRMRLEDRIERPDKDNYSKWV